MAFNDPFNTDPMNFDDNPLNSFGDEDPAADFLERERRELGDITGSTDVNHFNSPLDTTLENNNILTNGGYALPGNTMESYSSNQSNPSPYQALSEFNEPEKVRKWREEFSARISKKDAEEETKREEMRQQARKELDDFYRQRTEQLERTKGENRTNNRTFEDDMLNHGKYSRTSNGKVNDWDKIASLCDFNPKTNRSQKDLTRYRSVLLQLKQQQQTGGK